MPFSDNLVPESLKPAVDELRPYMGEEWYEAQMLWIRHQSVKVEAITTVALVLCIIGFFVLAATVFHAWK